MSKRKATILIVDDDQSYAEALGRTLSRDGFAPLIFTNPIDALNKIKITPPQFAIVDCMLPKKNGIDFVRELRAQGFDSLPVILMSGIFKDKSYSEKALKKTNAIKFYSKPFDHKELKDLIEKSLPKENLENKFPLSTFLMKEMVSARKRMKALDKVEEVDGYDMPLIMNVLIDGEVSGSLNIYSEDNNLFGLHIANGRITSFDSDKTNEIIKEIIIQKKYVDAEDLNKDYEHLKKGNFLENLVNECYLSPHVCGSIRTEQIFSELNKIIKLNNLKLNFSPSEVTKSDFSIEPHLITPFFADVINKEIPLTWLKKFYNPWVSLTLQYGPQFRGNHPVMSSPLVKKIDGLLDLIDDGVHLSDLINDKKYSEADVYKAIHLLAIYRLIVFEQESTILQAQGDISRLQSMFEILSTKNPIEIYSYFGSSPTASEVEVDKIYKELAKIYHPDKLPGNVSEEHKKLVNEIFRIITNGHNVLTNEKKRQEFSDQLKHKEAEKQMKAEAILDDGIKEVKKGRYSDAIILLEIASELHPSILSRVYVCWAKIKQAEQKPEDAELISQVKGILDNIPHEERSIPAYLHTLALFYKLTGKLDLAKSNFEKALLKDGSFIESRRELSILKEVTKSEQQTSLTDILNQDLSKVVSNFFKKKSS